MKVIGLISGTSADGIDAALVDITGQPPASSLKFLRFHTYPYPHRLSSRLYQLTSAGSVRDLCHLNFYLGELFAEAAQKISTDAGLKMEEIDLIGSHGQTVFHQPDTRKERGRTIRSTLQIAEPSIIAQRTGVTTVADFRPRDIAAGGHGAPLTPRLHYMLFRHPKRSRLVVNIGGISNLTYLKAGEGPESIQAFDTGPGNILIDGVIRQKTGGRGRMDRGGRLAQRGRVHERFLAELLRDPFVSRHPPKTTGREAYGEAHVLKMIKRAGTLRISKEDLVATVTAFTARTIAEGYHRFISPKRTADEVIVGGGGTRNSILIRYLKDAISPLTVRTFEDYGLDSKAIEAIAFALLAYETISGVPNNLPSVTGAGEAVIMGKIVPGKKGFPGGFTSRPFPGTPPSPHH
jgi:anhydro-N-acetylmuramic acid kinase